MKLYVTLELISLSLSVVNMLYRRVPLGRFSYISIVMTSDGNSGGLSLRSIMLMS